MFRKVVKSHPLSIKAYKIDFLMHTGGFIVLIYNNFLEILLDNIPYRGIYITIKELTYRRKNMAKCSNPNCKCENCQCGDDCQCGKVGNECHCTENCTCDDNCHCTENNKCCKSCTCGDNK